MADHSKIEWTEATWNPVRGCSLVSPGCTNCYAMRQAHRHANAGGAYERLTKLSKGGPVWTGEVRTVPELLEWPLRKRKPLHIFVNSMSDLFHEDVPDEFIDKVFSVMGQCDDGGVAHIFQILTKRGARMRDYVKSRGRAAWNAGRMNRSAWPARNVWLGVSVEDQQRADERIPLLLETPAAVRWISAEPLLEGINLRRVPLPPFTGNEPRIWPGLDWVVVGGESGPGARPFDIAWARSLRDQCRAAGVPFFLKQLGAEPRGWCRSHAPEIIGPEEARQMRAEDTDGDCDAFEASEQAKACADYGQRCVMLRDRKGGNPAEWPEDLRVREYPVNEATK